MRVEQLQRILQFMYKYNKMKQQIEEEIKQRQFNTNFPAVDLPTKNYSLDADMINGWRPKEMKLLGPIPLNFQSRVIDEIVDELTSYGRKYKQRVMYLGNRYASSFKIHTEMKHQYRFKHQSLINGNFLNMAAYFKKFHANFKPKNSVCRLFKGMNPTIKVGEEIIFDSCFESGNLDAAIKVGEDQYDLFMRVDTNTRGHVQWFNFTVKNCGKKKIKLNIANFKKYKTLYCRQLKPYVYSQYAKQSKGLEWHQAGQNVKYEKKKLRYSFLEQYFMAETITYNCLSFDYFFETQWEVVQFAYCPPFTYSQTLDLIADLKKNMATSILSEDKYFLKQTQLCESLGGLDIPLLTITDQQFSNKNKKCILVSGRIHPGETCGSHMMEGFLKYICSNDENAANLRKRVVFKVVPMLNPDGVVVGNFRTSLGGKDLNRQFRTGVDFLIPQVKALKQLVLQLKAQFKSRLIFFLDFHGHSVKKNVFLYGPEYEIWQNNYYRTRIFPKILSLKTQIFRIADFKRTTARAVILNNIPHCYTIQASTGFYYSGQQKKDIAFTPESWRFMGKAIGEGIWQYIQVMYDEDLTKQQRRQKLNDIKIGKGVKSRVKPQKNIYSCHSNSQSGHKQNQRANFQTRILSVSSSQKHKQGRENDYESQGLSGRAKQLIERIVAEDRVRVARKQEKNDQSYHGSQHESDQFSEGGSDSEGEEDDIPQEELQQLHKQIIDSLKQFRVNFLNQNKNDRQYSFKDSKKKGREPNLRGARQSKGVQMIASLRKKAEQMQKMKDVFVWPKLKDQRKSYTGKISKQNQSSPDYRTKINFRTYLEHIEKDKQKQKKKVSIRRELIFSSNSQQGYNHFNDSIFG